MLEINNLVPYLILPPPSPFYQWFVIARIVFILIFLFFLLGIIYFLSKTNWLKLRFLESTVEFFTYQPFGARKFIKQWDKIKRRLETGLEPENKLIVIEADSMFSDVLEKMGFIEKTFEARIKHLTPDLLSDIEQVLEAHKVRNNIVYDPNYQLTFKEAQKTISVYEKALTDLHIL